MGWYEVCSLGLAMTNINDVIANELVRRVRKMGTEELLALAAAKNKAATVRKASRSGAHRIELPSVPPGVVTIADAVMRVAGGSSKALSTAEIVAGVKGLRPDAQEPTVRAEISKQLTGGQLSRTGPRVGGSYSANRPGLVRAV